jgi:hypothetical protein
MEELAGQTFATRCAACHAKGDLTPLPNQLKKLSPKEIYAALRYGVMQEYALGIDDGAMHALAQFLGDPDAERKRPANGGAMLCSGNKSIGKSASAWPGWSLDTSNARCVARSLSIAEVQGLHLKWAFVFPDTQAFKGAANPLAVADGRVYVGSLNKWVYALGAPVNRSCQRLEGRMAVHPYSKSRRQILSDILLAQKPEPQFLALSVQL